MFRMKISCASVVLFGIYLTLTMFHKAEALQCYQCTGCNDEFVATGVDKQTCIGSCMKTKFQTNVIRDCSPLKMDTDCKEEERGGYSGAICFCNSDLCNGSAHVQVTMAMAVVVLATVFRNIL